MHLAGRGMNPARMTPAGRCSRQAVMAIGTYLRRLPTRLTTQQITGIYVTPVT